MDFTTIRQVLMPQVHQDVSVAHLLIMLVADGAIYLLIAFYVNNVLSGKFHVARPWYFPFQVTGFMSLNETQVD